MSTHLWSGTMGYVRGVSTERGSYGGIANGQVNKPFFLQYSYKLDSGQDWIISKANV